MNITLEKVNINDKAVFGNLFQLFAYDFSELMDMDICDNGRFPELKDMEEYYSKPNYCSYFVKVEGK